MAASPSSEARAGLLGLTLGLGRAEIGAQVEKIVLDAGEHRVRVGPVQRVQADEADRRIGFIDRAESLDPEGILAHARTRTERGHPMIPPACHHPVNAYDHAVLIRPSCAKRLTRPG